MLSSISTTLFGEWGENVVWPLLVAVIGGLLVVWLRYLLVGRRKRSSAVPITRVELAIEPPKPPKLIEVEKKSQRYRHVLDLINEGKINVVDKLTITEMARMLDRSRVGKLEEIFSGIIEPDEMFSRRFANTFGINLSWLLDGKLEPYTPEGPVKTYPHEYWEYIMEIVPTNIYFVRAHDDVGETIILLKQGEWKYIRLDYTWNISGCVGGTGRSQIMSLYELILRFRSIPLHQRRFFLGGYLLKTESFDDIISGKIFPGTNISRKSQSSWWNELARAGDRYWQPDEYEAHYGRSFVEAQEIIREQLGLKGK